MIKYFLLLLPLFLPLFSANITNQNIYEKDDRVDIMLSFDAPFHGKITQKKEDKNRILILTGASIEQKTSKDIASDILQKLSLTPYHDKVVIALEGDGDFQVNASKTVDLYGLRLRITPAALFNETANSNDNVIETKKEDDMSVAFSKVMLILLALLAFLYFFKKWLSKQGGVIQGNWLFSQKKASDKSDIKVTQQRALDVKNRLVLASYKDKEYLLLLGNSNLLIDSFDTHTKSNNNDFDEILTENEESLNYFIKQKNKNFDNYKKKISQEE